MRNISTWAKYNPWKARFIIFICHLLLITSAIFVGISLKDFDIRISQAVLFLTVMVFLITAAIYPRRYVYRKAADCIIALCSFISVCFLANNYEMKILSGIFPTYGATTLDPSSGKPTAKEILASLSHRDKSTLTRTEKRILKKELRRQVKEFAKAKVSGNKKRSNEALSIIMTIIGALGLIGALAVLSCHIACTGSETVAIFLFIIGTAGIIIGAVYLIKVINREKKKNRLSARQLKQAPYSIRPDQICNSQQGYL
jgi:predicted permease